MDFLTSAVRRQQAFSALLLLFFVSGATALVYQTLWTRQLHLVFGTSTFAIATVLSAFMLGLAIGGIVMARFADALKHPLRVYGYLEVVIGVYAAAFPFLLTATSPVYRWAYTQLEPGPVLFGVIQFLLVGTLLVLPTAFMGATLPLLARFATHRFGEAGSRVGTLYAVNTAGAVFGTLLAGFYLLPMLGLALTTWLAALANIVLGAVAIRLDRWVGQGESDLVPVEEDVAPPSSELLVPVSIALALAGFASLVYEVAWTRLMSLMIGASVYAFSVMLLAFLIGIALGGKWGGGYADRLLVRHGRGGVLRALAAVEVGVGVLSCGLMYVYPELPLWYVWLVDAFGGAEWAQGTWLVSLLLSGVVMTLPAVLMGVAFPLAVRAVVGAEGRLGGPVGKIYGFNTLGGVLGAFLAGFVLLPTIQVQGTIFVAASANLLAALLLLMVPAARSSRALGLAGVGMSGLVLVMVVRTPPWDPMLMTAGMYHYIEDFDDHSREGIMSYAVEKYDLLFYEEGLSSVVTVAQNHHSGNMWLANNGKIDASTSTDMPTQVLCSILPTQFVEKPDDVLVIGLASGITAGALSLIPEIERLDVVELEPAIERAAHYFGSHNHDVLDDPRTRLLANDGRNHLVLTEEETYDLIVSEPSNPWITGVSNLFTKEFWEMGKKRLKPGGVWSQWVQMYGMDDQDLKSLLGTFAEVYPHVLVYATIEDADLVLVGSDEPLAPSIPNAQRLFDWSPGLTEELNQLAINEPLDIVAMFQLDRPGVERLSDGAPFNTDDNMRIEYRAPKNLHLETAWTNMKLMMKHTSIPLEFLEPDAVLFADLARVYQERDDIRRAWWTMDRAVRMLPSEDPMRLEWAKEAVGWREALTADEAEELD